MFTNICKIFADDTKVYNQSLNNNIVQKDLNSLQEWSDKWQLHFNNIKCKCLYSGKNNQENQYHLNDKSGIQVIGKCIKEKDLGITFDSTMKFDIHINSVINKGNKILGLIKRNFKYIDKHIFNSLYKALICSNLEYGQTIKRQSVTIENVQRRTTKLVASISKLPYKERLKYLNLHSLKYRRIRGDLIQIYKLIKDPNHSSNLIKLSDIKCTRGHNLKLYKETCKTDARKFSFPNRAINDWNSLHSNTVNATNINVFKKLLDEDLKNLLYEVD